MVLVIERMELSEITPRNAPFLYNLANSESVGLTAVRKPVSYKNIASGFYSTIGAGSGAAGFEPKNNTAPRLDRAGDEIILSDRAERISEYNKNRNVRATFGALGQSLHDAGRKTAAIDISPTGRVEDASFLDMVMDTEGRIDLFRRVKTPSEAAAELRRAHSKASLILVNLSNIRKTETDSTARRLAKETNGEDLLIVLMPFSRANVDYGISKKLISKGEPLSPLIIRSPELRTGLLKSGTTRRLGVISASDIMPTILKHLGIKTTVKHTGKSVYVIRWEIDRQAFLVKVGEKALRHDAFMFPVLTFLVGLSLLIIVATLMSILVDKTRRFKGVFQTLLLLVFILPFMLNIEALFSFNSLAAVFFFLCSASIVLLALFSRIKDGSMLPAIALSLTPSLLLLDTFLTRTIADGSLMGNSVLSGGRYYGLGNQFLGLLFIHTVLFFVLITTARPEITKTIGFRLLSAVTFFILLVTVGSSRLGANFGGLITLSAALPTVYFLLIGRGTVRKKHILIAVAVMVGTVFVFTLFDVVQKSPDQSHIASLLSKDAAFAWSIIITKISKNLEETTMILYEWGGFLIFALVGALLVYGKYRLGLTMRTFPVFRRCLPGIILGAVVAYFFNDTGFEPLAIIGFYTLAAFLYLQLDYPAYRPRTERSSSNSSRSSLVIK